MKLNSHVQAAFAALLFTGLLSCQKDMATITNKTSDAATDSAVKRANAANAFTTYTIRAGQHYCVGNSYPSFEAPALYFTVQFDSSAIYQSKNPQNQHDENKLYGFSDNNSLHHQYSARFGWRWCNNELELSAYTYNKGVRSDKVLGAVPIGVENKCAIIVRGDHYDFVVNGVITSVPRASKTVKAKGYNLLPYFGGDEVAPHTVTIKIREDKSL
ncbi:hypothetical protein FC093_05320 [Ilyomonas limi]|uniref:Uncharacterized protein n=1 Tax=Ilyomonas limi TaxID=2575867 RepID=A0A4U3L597_9BACT|nr:hypothetical protein [Ilyomonas limi]TKK70170.1 hypothetical protein FC093_05320 [Ilyomonas limi]